MDDALNVTDEQAIAALARTVIGIAEAMGIKIDFQLEGKAGEVDRDKLYEAVRRHTLILSHIVTRSGLAELYVAESHQQEVQNDS